MTGLAPFFISDTPIENNQAGKSAVENDIDVDLESLVSDEGCD